MENNPTWFRSAAMAALTLSFVAVSACSSPGSDRGAESEPTSDREAITASVFDGIRRAPVIRAAQAVCDGTADSLPDAPAYDPQVDPLILTVHHADNPEDPKLESQADEIIGLPHLLVCIEAKMTDEVAATCEYDGNLTVEYRVTDWTARLVRADNAEVLDSATRRGSEASCSTVVFTDRVRPLMAIRTPSLLEFIADIDRALDPHEQCRIAMQDHDPVVEASTTVGLSARLIMPDYNPGLVLPEVWRAENQADADVALCTQMDSLGRTIRAVTADGSVIGDWMFERPEGQSQGTPLPMPVEWFETNVAPALGR